MYKKYGRKKGFTAGVKESLGLMADVFNPKLTKGIDRKDPEVQRGLGLLAQSTDTLALMTKMDLARHPRVAEKLDQELKL